MHMMQENYDLLSFHFVSQVAEANATYHYWSKDHDLREAAVVSHFVQNNRSG